MRHSILVILCVGAVGLAGCEQTGRSSVARAVKDLNVIDETNLSEVMLTVGDPNEAVTYFRKSSLANPERLDLKRGLAMSLTRAKKRTEAVATWQQVVAHQDHTMDDQINLSDALIRNGQWKRAEAELNKVPPTVETYKRYRLEAMVADSNKNWKKADSFYETAVGLTTKPASVLNNWGYSKLTRGDFKSAERLFGEALGYDAHLFTAKNNMILARGAQRNYTLPIIKMTQTERAQLLYSLALTAIKQGDVSIGKGLLQEAIDTHPQYFEAAARSLNALENKANNG